MEIKTHTAMRYVTPLREGGSLPAVVEVETGELYVMKFAGARQGPRMLVAELIAGEIARALGLPVPELAFVNLEGALAPREPNAEISDLLRASAGLNLGMCFLSNALAFSPLLKPPPPADLASTIVWFDAYVTNVDRTVRNPNIVLSGGKLWLIDNGAALYFHYDWRDYLARARSPFPRIKDHVLLRFASTLDEAAAFCRELLTSEVLSDIVGLVPDAWLDDQAPFEGPAGQRAAYLEYLLTRLDAAPIFLEEAKHARALLV